GNEVATLVNEEKPAGSYEVEFNSHSDEGQNLPAGRQGLSSGIYFYTLQAGNFTQTKKLILMK
ncbi:MAG: T9SS type A sorting domain-containing protein, partial [Ignavibacteriaceae bacterium]|nr:T9SS type A sorting domain-containing protein [Ignavibacteriaceae bacterium]